MIRAILKNGVIKPAEPLPPDWVDGQELRVDRDAPSDDPGDIDRWASRLDGANGTVSAEDIDSLQRALETIERESKDNVRREWGLP